jgi:pyruvate dehydrogenase E2 component (dihydrolipoamide acetyltransferase)
MPRLGWATEEGVLVEWLKADGDTVGAGEIVCVIESDKAQNEVEVFEGGTLRIPPGSPPPGVRVPVGTLLAYVLAPGERPPFEGRAAAPVAVPALPPSAAPGPGPTGSAPAPAGRPVPGRAAPISPRARRVARELGVDWTGLTGSGRTGRIVERDVRAAGGAPAGADARPAARSQVRRLVVERMATSARTTAPVTLTTEADATELVRLRDRLAVPSYNDLLAKLVAIALGEHPALNASLAGDAIVYHQAVHVGLAVDTERGLLVGVLRDVARTPIRQLAAESAGLIARIRAGRATPEDLGGGTFTITNLGMYDIDAFTPIVNLPECAILGVGRLVSRPVVVDEATAAIAVRKMLALSLTFDHRVVDGAPAARFLQRVKRLVETPPSDLER